MTDEELVKRLRELRNNQYADPSTAPEFVFLDPDLPPSEWEKQYSMDVVYVRADRIEALTKERDEAMQLLQTLSNMNGDLSRDMYKTKLLLAKTVEGLRDAVYAWDNHNKTGDMMQGHWVTDARATLSAVLNDVAEGKAEIENSEAVTLGEKR